MTETPPERFEIPTLILDTWKMRNPSTVTLIPAEFPALIGRVAYSWGEFEVIFEAMLAALIKADGLGEAKRRDNTFKSRRRLFKELWAKHLADDCPLATQLLDTVFAEIDANYRRRNLAVHGRMMTEFGGANIVRLVCIGRYSGQDVVERFTADELDDLFYEIIHLNGRLNYVATGCPRMPTSPETQRLRAFLSTNHPTYPTQATLAPPPQSSRG
jgi:hypothetical protein